jgi:acyl-CoA thioesterase-1
VRLTNAGISGSTSASGPGRLKWALKSSPLPDIVIVELGANDGLRGIDPKATKANLRETIRLAKDRGVLVLLAGMRMPPNYGPGYTEEFSALFSELAKEEGVPLIPFFLDRVAGERSLNQPDGIHPNEAGYKIIAQTVLPHLEPLLKKAASP